MVNKRNVEARFDTTVFNNIQENSKCIREDGKESAIFNPKTPDNEIIQDLTIYEISHYIFSQKTKAGKDLYKDVLEHDNTDKIYKKMRTELEDL